MIWLKTEVKPNLNKVAMDLLYFYNSMYAVIEAILTLFKFLILSIWERKCCNNELKVNQKFLAKFLLNSWIPVENFARMPPAPGKIYQHVFTVIVERSVL
jgi:hypothetical protein